VNIRQTLLPSTRLSEAVNGPNDSESLHVASTIQQGSLSNFQPGDREVSWCDATITVRTCITSDTMPNLHRQAA
jgi:hypothetical protein